MRGYHPEKTINLQSGESGRYWGERRDGARHGRGTMQYTDGKTYSGEWSKGSPDGEGVIWLGIESPVPRPESNNEEQKIEDEKSLDSSRGRQENY